MLTRRKWFDLSVRTGASLLLAPGLLRALEKADGKLLQRAIPSSGEMLPVIGFGSRPTDDDAIKGVLKALLDHGGKVVDTLHGGPPGEQLAATVAKELGIQKKIFWTTPVSAAIPLLPGYVGLPPKVEPSMVRALVEAKLAAFDVPKIDVAQVLMGDNVATHLAVLREMKKEGRVRYIGITDLAPPPYLKNIPFYPKLESILRNEPIDFIGVDYSVGDRRVEEKILPLAQERKVGVMAYFPFDRSRIFQRAKSTPLPEWAAEFDAKTWAQFFLKYVISHPAITVARTGTTKPEHMLDNLAGGIGRLPDEATRKRMAELVDSLPPTPPPGPPKPQKETPEIPPVALSTAILDRYVGEYEYAAVGTIVTFRRDGEKLLVKIAGNFPECPLVARSETRFVAPPPWEASIEFLLDDHGKVKGAVVEQGPQKIPLTPT